MYISIICTCSTIFFCEAALLVFRAFCVGHAISAAAPGSRIMSSCPLSYVYLYIPVQMLRLLSSVLRACCKAVGLCHIWIFVHREPAPELWIILSSSFSNFHEFCSVLVPVQTVGLADVINAGVFTVRVGAGKTSFSLIDVNDNSNYSLHCIAKVKPRNKFIKGSNETIRQLC